MPDPFVFALDPRFFAPNPCGSGGEKTVDEDGLQICEWRHNHPQPARRRRSVAHEVCIRPGISPRCPMLRATDLAAESFDPPLYVIPVEFIEPNSEDPCSIFDLPLRSAEFCPLQFREHDILCAGHKQRYAVEFHLKAAVKFREAERTRLANDEIDLPTTGEIDHIELPLVL